MIELEKELGKKYANQYLIYTRKSTDDAENQKNSIGYQILEGKRFVERSNISLASLTIDSFCNDGIIEEHHSGYKQDYDFATNGDGTITYKVLRPKFLTLVNLLKAKAIRGVICLCWDRISRNESDDVLIKKLISQGVDIRFCQTKYEDTSSGALHMDIDGMFSRHYSRVISEKVKNSSKKLLAEGRCIRNSPIGYLDQGSDNKPLDKERAPIIKRVFELYATGEWSFVSLSHWANQQGLTTKPARRKRSKEEKARGVSIESIGKQSRPVTHKNIETILRNPFYIGKNVHNKTWIDSKAHQPLIDTSLFYQVQSIMRQKTVRVHYPNLIFYTYRGLIRCKYCERVYTPYIQKSIVYYRSRCKPGCINKHKNINENYITKRVSILFSKMYFSDYEISIINTNASQELKAVTERRSSIVEDIYRQLNKTTTDLEFLIKNKLNLLRNGVYSPEQITQEESRLNAIIDNTKIKLETQSETSQAMLDYVILFSQLLKNATCYFQFALDSEKRDFVKQVFSELYIEDGELKYAAKETFAVLLGRHSDKSWQTGCPHYLFSELERIYQLAKQQTPITHQNSKEYI